MKRSIVYLSTCALLAGGMTGCADMSETQRTTATGAGIGALAGAGLFRFATACAQTSGERSASGFGDEDLDAPVLGAAGGGAVVGDRFARAATVDTDAVAGDAARDQIIPRGRGAID